MWLKVIQNQDSPETRSFVLISLWLWKEEEKKIKLPCGDHVMTSWSQPEAAFPWKLLFSSSSPPHGSCHLKKAALSLKTVVWRSLDFFSDRNFSRKGKAYRLIPHRHQHSDGDLPQKRAARSPALLHSSLLPLCSLVLYEFGDHPALIRSRVWKEVSET